MKFYAITLAKCGLRMYFRTEVNQTFTLVLPEGRQLWVECTVAQRSDEFKGAIATARRLRDVINDMDTRPFGLSWMLLGHSSKVTPSESKLKKTIKRELSGYIYKKQDLSSP